MASTWVFDSQPPASALSQQVAFFQQYQEFVGLFKQSNPQLPAPAIDQYKIYLQINASDVPAQDVAPAIQPDLELAAEVADIRKQLDAMKRARLEDEEDEADDEGEENRVGHKSRGRKRAKRSRGRAEPEQVLSLGKTHLTGAQLTVRKALKVKF